MGKDYTVVIADFVGSELSPEIKVLGELAEVVALGATSESELEGKVERADALMVYHQVRLGSQTLSRLEKCRVISRCGVGYDNVDLAVARSRGIPVCNVPDYGTSDVADAAIGMAVALTRGTFYLNSRLRAGLGEWAYTQAAPLQRLRGSVFGIVGLGRIGTATTIRATALGMDVVFYDPYKPDGYDSSLGIRRAESLSQLLEQVLVLSLHCQLTPETCHMISEAALARLPMGSYLVNTARGAVVDTAALLEAIASGRLAGAALDVLEVEPPPPDDPLLVAWRDPHHPAHHRLILTPHSAFYSESGMAELRTKCAENCRRVLLGLPLRNVVNE